MSATCHFAQPVRDFLAYLRVEAGLAPATLEAYTRDLRDLIDELRSGGAAEPASVTPDDLVAHMRGLHRERSLQPSSIARHLSTIRIFFRFLVANGALDDDPTRLLETPTRWKRLPGVLSPRQMKQLLAAPSPDDGRLWRRDRAMLEMMYAAGLRASELAILSLRDYNATLGVVLVTGKGRKQRIVPVGSSASTG